MEKTANREVEKDNSESCAAVQELVSLTPTKGCYDEHLEKPSSKAYITFNECSSLINMSSYHSASCDQR